MKKDPYGNKKKMNDELQKRDEIVFEENIDALFSLKDNSDFSITLHEILVKRHHKKANSLSAVELNLFLCMHLENAGQADSILSFLQEWFPEYKNQVVDSLKIIKATNSSKIIKQAIELLPKNGSWFYESSNQKSENLMDKLDKDFSDYPDGPLRDLYRKYAEKHKDQIKK